MKKKFCTMIAMLLVVILCSSTLAEVYVDLKAYYELICQYTEAGAYELVVETYNEHSEELKHYRPDSAKYYKYAKGMLALGIGGEEFSVDLEEAYEIFKELSFFNNGKNFPDKEILDHAVNTAYIADCETVFVYTQARIAEESGDFETAINLYKEAGFADSYSRGSDLFNRMLDNRQIDDKRISSYQLDAKNDSIHLDWTDSVETDGYTVVYMPNGGGEQKIIEVTECTAELAGLLPNTEYQIQLFEDNELLAEFSSKTAKYNSLKGNISRGSRAAMIYCRKSEAQKFSLQDLSKRGMLNECEKTEDGSYQIFVNKGFAEGFFNQYITIDISNQSAVKNNMDWMLVLRLSKGGTFSVSGTTAAPVSGLRVPSPLVISINELLEKVFIYNNDQWLQTKGMIELYIDGMYTDEVAITLTID